MEDDQLKIRVQRLYRAAFKPICSKGLPFITNEDWKERGGKAMIITADCCALIKPKK